MISEIQSAKLSALATLQDAIDLITELPSNVSVDSNARRLIHTALSVLGEAFEIIYHDERKNMNAMLQALQFYAMDAGSKGEIARQAINKVLE